MSEQNKTTNAPAANTAKPGHTDTSGAQPAKDANTQNATQAPDHEQGREYKPTVVAQKDAADTRRTAEQSHVPTATSQGTPKPAEKAPERKENEAGDAKRTTAEGQGDRKPGNDPVKPTGNTTTH